MVGDPFGPPARLLKQQYKTFYLWIFSKENSSSLTATIRFDNIGLVLFLSTECDEFSITVIENESVKKESVSSDSFLHFEEIGGNWSNFRKCTAIIQILKSHNRTVLILITSVSVFHTESDDVLGFKLRLMTRQLQNRVQFRPSPPHLRRNQ